MGQGLGRKTKGWGGKKEPLQAWGEQTQYLANLRAGKKDPPLRTVQRKQMDV